MARVTFKTGITTAGKNGGFTHYSTPTKDYARATAVTLFPATPLQQNATIGLAQCAQAWAGYDAAFKAVVLQYAPAGSTAYAYFSTIWMYLWTYGIEGDIVAAVQSRLTAPNDSTLYAWGDGSSIFFSLSFVQPWPSDRSYTLYFYLTPQVLWPYWIPAVSGGSYVNVPQNSAPIYIGSLPVAAGTITINVDITAEVMALFGQYPQYWVVGWPYPFMEGGSAVQISFTYSDQYGEMGMNEYREVVVTAAAGGMLNTPPPTFARSAAQRLTLPARHPGLRRAR